MILLPPMETKRQDRPTSWPAPSGVTVMADILNHLSDATYVIFFKWKNIFTWNVVNLIFQKEKIGGKNGKNHPEIEIFVFCFEFLLREIEHFKVNLGNEF